MLSLSLLSLVLSVYSEAKNHLVDIMILVTENLLFPVLNMLSLFELSEYKQTNKQTKKGVWY